MWTNQLRNHHDHPQVLHETTPLLSLLPPALVRSGRPLAPARTRSSTRLQRVPLPMNDEHDERESVLATNLPTQSNCGDSCFNCGVESYACSHNVSSSVGAVFVIVLPGGDLLRFVDPRRHLISGRRDAISMSSTVMLVLIRRKAVLQVHRTRSFPFR